MADSYIDLLKKLAVVSPERYKLYVERMEHNLPEIIEDEKVSQVIIDFDRAGKKQCANC